MRARAIACVESSSGLAWSVPHAYHLLVHAFANGHHAAGRPDAFRQLRRGSAPRVLELTYTAWDIQAFARGMGDEGSLFVWDEERRFW
jgi:hypothetical protein